MAAALETPLMRRRPEAWDARARRAAKAEMDAAAAAGGKAKGKDGAQRSVGALSVPFVFVERACFFAGFL